MNLSNNEMIKRINDISSVELINNVKKTVVYPILKKVVTQLKEDVSYREKVKLNNYYNKHLTPIKFRYKEFNDVIDYFDEYVIMVGNSELNDWVSSTLLEQLYKIKRDGKPSIRLKLDFDEFNKLVKWVKDNLDNESDSYYSFLKSKIIKACKNENITLTVGYKELIVDDNSVPVCLLHIVNEYNVPKCVIGNMVNFNVSCDDLEELNILDKVEV